MPIATMRPKSCTAGDEHMLSDENPIAVVIAANVTGWKL